LGHDAFRNAYFTFVDEVCGDCPWYRGTINKYRVLIQMKKVDYLGDLGVDGRIILK